MHPIVGLPDYQPLVMGRRYRLACSIYGSTPDAEQPVAVPQTSVGTAAVGVRRTAECVLSSTQVVRPRF